MKISGIILAGGKSRRLGRTKAIEPFLDKTLLQHVFDCLVRIVDQVIIVTSQDLAAISYPKGITVLTDIYPGHGPLSGVYTGLTAAKNQYSIVVGCDMPFLNSKLLIHMAEGSRNFDAGIARLNAGTIEPLHAVYSRTCIEVIKLRLDRKQLQIRKLFDEIKVKYFDEGECRKYDPSLNSFININNQKDMDKALVFSKQLRKGQPC